MNKQLEYDMLNIDALLERTKLQGLDYLHTINSRKTSTHLLEIKDTQVEKIGMGGIDALELFNHKFENIIVGSGGPRYLGYIIGGATPASIIGDWLATIYDQNPQTNSSQGDISVEIEKETINLIIDLLNLPNDFLGGFVSGATMSNFTCLAVARQWIGKQLNKDFAKDGISEQIKILSAEPHSSVVKTLAMLGIGSNNIDYVKQIKGNREAVDICELEKKIIELNTQPFILVSSAGTVNTADFDNFEAIYTLKKKYNFWWHIDAAFGAFAACSPKYQHLVKGWEWADSICIDCHKWLNVPYESAVFLVNKKYKSLQVETFQNTNAPYLGSSVNDFNYLNLLPENSRRLKALPAWFSIVAYGKLGYQEIVENSINMAVILGDFIEKSDFFDLLAPVRLNNVCFSLKGEENKDVILNFLYALNKSAKVYMSPTVYKNKQAIRASFVNWRTTKQDIDIIIDQLQNALNKIINV